MESSGNTDTSIAILLLIAAGLPVISFIVSFLIPSRYSWVVAITSSVLLLGSAILGTVALTHTSADTALLFSTDWFEIGERVIRASIHISRLSTLMFSVVAVVSFLIHLYSAGYMASDSSVRKYYAMLGFFTFAMFGIVLADNLLLLFLFWELVGFSSYMLIGHYNSKLEGAQASTKAFIVNRIGDVAFIAGLMIVWSNTDTFDIASLVSTNSTAGWRTVASLCFFLGIAGKSAQFPLFTWLPDAMAGPTPVSALIHAATMVAAGVYLMIRIFPVFTDTALIAVSTIGAVTSLLAALAATAQFDIKRILAYSTISQLGLMFIALGMKAVDAAWLHLFSHAFFKACLFLCAGSVIHALHATHKQQNTSFDEQDIRQMGGLRRSMPVTFIAFIISAAALAGIPFTSGFLSKDFILTMLWQNESIFGRFLFITTCVISIITVIYTFRLIWFVFLAPSARHTDVVESPVIMRVPMIILASCSCWLVVSPNPFNFDGWIVKTSNHSALVIGVSISIVLLATLFSYLRFKQNQPRSIFVLREAFLIDRFSVVFAKSFSRQTSSITSYADRKLLDRSIHFAVIAQVTMAHGIAWIDRHIIDGIVTTVITIVRFCGNIIRSLGGGKIQHYVFWSLFAIIIFIIWALN